MAIRRYQEILESEINNMVAKQNKVTDFNEGSIVHSLLDTVARVAERIYVSIRQGYNDLLELMAYSIFGYKKKDGLYASGTVIFSRGEPIDAKSIITRGTKISSGSVSFTTTENAVIEPGEISSSEVTAIADEVGMKGNVAAGAIENIDSNVPADVIYVTNEKPFSGGTDIESDADFQQRFKYGLNGMSGTNNYAIMKAALDINEVRSVSYQNHKPPLDNIYNASIYIDDGSGSATQKTIEAVKNAIEGDMTELNPGHLCPGINVRYLAPTILPVDITAIVSFYNADRSSIQKEITDTITEYINSLTISESVVLSDIIKKIMTLSYVKDVKIVSPMDNITPAISQICRSQTIDISLVEVE